MPPMRIAHFIKLLPLFFGGMVLLHLFVAWHAGDLARQGYPDFTIFYSAGKIVDRGLGHDLYDWQTQYRIQKEFAPGVGIRQGPLPYNHPPFEALLFVPFAALPYFAAYLLWDLASLVVLLAIFALLRPEIAVLRDGPLLYWLLVSLALFPVFIALLQGQDVLLLVLLFTLTFLALKRGHDFSAGCWLGLGLFRFHLILPMLLVLLLQRRRKAGLGFLAVAAALGLVSLLLVGWHGVVTYPAFVWQVEKILGQGALTSADMPCIRGLLDAVAGSRIPQSVSRPAVIIISTALLGYVAAFWKKTDVGIRFDLGFSLCVIMTILVSYHSFIYDYSLLLLPLAITASNFRTIWQTDFVTRFAIAVPFCALLFSPLQIAVVIIYERGGFLAILLLLWMWGIARLSAGTDRPVAPRVLAPAS